MAHAAQGSTELGKTFDSIDDSALLALGLMAEVAKGEESKWWPYIRTVLDTRLLPSLEPNALTYILRLWDLMLSLQDVAIIRRAAHPFTLARR